MDNFSKSLNKRLVLGVILTGIISLQNIAQLFILITEFWNGAPYATEILNAFLFTFSIIMSFVALIKIWISGKPFSKTLTNCMSGIGIVYTSASFFACFIPGVMPTGLQILGFQFKKLDIFIQGNYLTYGLLMLVFSEVLKYGLEYQHDSELTL
ncbi:MAG: hypothetical protein RSD97_04460 [Lachnospiraceae bacterium]